MRASDYVYFFCVIRFPTLRNLLVVILLLGVISVDAVAQNRIDRERLEQIAARANKAVTWDRSLALRPGRPRVGTDSTDARIQLLGLRAGRPFLYITHNIKAAATARTTALARGGRTGLDLMGNAQRIGLWDGGGVLTTHRELRGRVAQRDTTTDSINHATHVAGTLAASGRWDIVRGMAPEAFVDAYDWNSDTAEMAAAAADGLILSNHSYGVPLGWTPNIQGDGLWGWMGDPIISTRVDFRFGRYDEQAADWDDIAWAAPEYLIVKSAGNERARQGPRPGEPHYIYHDGWIISTDTRDRDSGDSGYDTIGDGGTAKNVLTIGATESAPWGILSPEDVVMTSFSGWGPTDDGRIKPDLVAPGVMLMSSKAAHDESYGPSSGTSMAAPVVAGSAALLQELFMREYSGTRPLSSTIRGLLIHSADEAGEFPGPDYRFGWGHINSERAALHIRQAALSSRTTEPNEIRLIEGTISGGNALEFTVSVAHDQPLRATLAWTDPAGSVLEPALNDRSLMLVNDLDLEIIGPNGTHYPWTLDPEHPERPAIRGPNFRDNVEQVLFQATPGQYVVRVRARHSLHEGAQLFSLLIGQANQEEGTEQTFTISGSLLQRDVGIQDVMVRIQGPEWAGFRTTKDGVFYFSDLPGGSYTVIPTDPLLTFDPVSKQITLPGDDGRMDFEVIPPLRLHHVRLFESSRLMHSSEQDVAVDVETAAAGGVYGLSFVFSSDIAPVLAGLRVHVDTSFDPWIAPYSGQTGNSMLDLSIEWTLSNFSPFRLSKRVPAIWFSGNTPIPHVARLPYSIRTDTDQILFADTLRIIVDRSDDMAPIVHPAFRLAGLAYAPPGGTMEIRAGYLDGSRVRDITALLLDRTDESTVLQEVPLRDSGDLASDLDTQEGDGIFTAKFIPRLEAEYRLALRSVDEHGNATTLLSDAYYSSTPFEPRGEVLFHSVYERGSRTNTHLEIFNRIGFAYSWWDELTRGRLEDRILADFPLLVWARHQVSIDTEEDMSQLASYIRSGGFLIIMGQDLSSEASGEWIKTELGVRVQDRIATAASVTGDGPLVGFEAELAGGARPSALSLTRGGEPLLWAGPDLVAARIGRVIVSSITAASFGSISSREGFLSRLLFLASGNPEFVRAPEIPVVRWPDGFEATEDSVLIAWDEQPFSEYDVQVASADLFDAPLVEERTPYASIFVGPLPRGERLFFRIRALNPSGTSAWSEALSFQSRPLNQAPIVTAPGTAIEIGLGLGVTTLSLALHFSDPDGGNLAFEASIEPDGIAELLVTHDQLQITPVSEGDAVITVSATDPESASVSTTFLLRVAANSSPVASGLHGNDATLLVGQSLDWPTSELFTDPDGDVLSISVSVADPGVASVSLENGLIMLLALSTGSTRVITMAEDGRGGEAAVIRKIRVRTNAPPLSLRNDYATETLLDQQVVLAMREFFTDPDGDDMTFSVLSPGQDLVYIRHDSLFASFPNRGRYALVISAEDAFGASSSIEISISARRGAALSRSSQTIPVSFDIVSVYPMPFAKHTTFVVHIPQASRLVIMVYSASGREVARIVDRPLDAGKYHLDWSPEGLSAGIYFYRAIWNNHVKSGALIRTR